MNNDYFVVYTSPEGNPGYVIISTDDRLPALIGFSDTQRFTAEDMPPAMQDLLVQYITRIDDIPDRTPTMRRANSPMELAPLLGDIAFSQGSPYNDMCPLLNGKRTATGCLATAMAQIMAYYKYPTQMLGDKIEYETMTHHLPVSWDCANTKFDWNNILDTYPSETIPEYTANETTTAQQYMYFKDITLSDKNTLEIHDFYSRHPETMTFDLQLLLCDNTDRFIRPIGEMKTIKGLKPTYGWGSYPIKHFLSPEIADGDYRMYLGVRLEGTTEWSVVERRNQKNQYEAFYLPLTKQGMSYTMEGRTFACGHTKAQGEAIATLMAACGASTGMNYAEQSSTGNSYIADGYIKYMGYSDRLYFLYSNKSPSRAWMENQVEAELLEGRPVYCCGITKEEGSHAFVIDGFQYYQGTTPYYHVNWGWNGDDDGFFLLDAMTTSGGDNYGYSYILTMNIAPADGRKLGFMFDAEKVSASINGKTLNLSVEYIYNRSQATFGGDMRVYAIDVKGQEYFLTKNHWNAWGYNSGYTSWSKQVSIPDTLPDGEYTIVLKLQEDGSDVVKEVLTPAFPKVTIGNGTSIAGVKQSEQAPEIYSLTGRRLSSSAAPPEKLPKGIYIINGKKYISE